MRCDSYHRRFFRVIRVSLNLIWRRVIFQHVGHLQNGKGFGSRSDPRHSSSLSSCKKLRKYLDEYNYDTGESVP